MASLFSPSTPFICSSRIVSTTSSSSQPIQAVKEPYSRWVNAQTNNSFFNFFISVHNKHRHGGAKVQRKALGKEEVYFLHKAKTNVSECSYLEREDESCYSDGRFKCTQNNCMH